MSILGASTPSQRLRELGIELPSVPTPVAAYIPATRVGNQIWTSGQLPIVNGALQVTGHVGDSAAIQDDETLQVVSPEAAKGLARVALLNALAAVAAELDDGIDGIQRIIKLTGFVASTPDFTGQPGVVNGASELAGEIFGDAGLHVRSAVGVAALPLDAPVELELIVEV